MKIPISVLVVIYKSNGEVLLIERADKAGFWQSVTGSLDAPDEDLGVAAAREVLEETGIDVESLPVGALQDMHHQIDYEIYPQWRHRYAPGVTRNTEHWFSLLVPDATPVTLAPREHVAYQWLPYLEAAKTCFSESNGEAIVKLFSATEGGSV
ncbi:dihydroneopterin triphosphate diphosphatase [Polynucleobacter sp. AP-Nino-20-G2]|uniref:dihydroneopterin triphosphate diphosphatase n=1 Tax=Polynucleobacter sp. AP-Nino-20-G2 TaxID=2576917 RepID=UPI001BFDFC46|nr:dihydroneopterin triphosphate diphosphatase [Polynucleobacter sp. AP-Nino-20-G2]QWE16488.1 dihydroneopterin triphosphate diphosphatase [Polynucleobacter sp. AP-Nino-20-G2]